MKYGTLLSIIGAVGMMTLFSMHTAHAATVLSTAAVAAHQFNAPLTTSGELPEPATWAMLIMGFGAIGVTLRRGRALRLKAASVGQ